MKTGTSPASPSNLPQLIHAERETQRDEAYLWDNRTRQAGTLVLQRTLSGAAFYATGGRRELVPAGKAMLFEWGEDSTYGIGPPGQRPYVLDYITVERSGGIGELADQIRRDFGSIVTMDSGADAARILREIVTDYASGRRRDRLELAELLYRLMLAVYREQLAGTRGEDPVGYGHHLICNRYRSPLNLKELVAQLGISREHFTRVFTARYGEAPAAMLRRLRLEHARLLARTGTLPAEDLAPACGFANAQSFRRAFRQHFGHTVGRERIER